jgi:hypothetical protein
MLVGATDPRLSPVARCADEQREAHEDGRRRPHRRQGHHAQVGTVSRLGPSLLIKSSKFFDLFFRKKKAVHKTAITDDKRLQSTLKRVGVNTIPAIEEVNIFKDDLVIQFLNPKGPSHSFLPCWLVTPLSKPSVTDLLLLLLLCPTQCKLPSRQTPGWSVELHTRKVILFLLFDLVEQSFV